MNQITEAKENRVSAFVQIPYTIYCVALFLVLGLTVMVINLFLGKLRARRAIAGSFARAFMRASGIRVTVAGMQHLPTVPCIVVANHASYIDGLVAAAALPPEFAFVIKKEMGSVPLAGLLLRRLGSQFVERFDRHKGGVDARRVLKLAATGQSLVFFPEGTFGETPQIGKFHAGAFATAARFDMPVVAMAIIGARKVMPAGAATIRPRPIRVEILEVLAASDARQRSRELIAHAVGEPLAS